MNMPTRVISIALAAGAALAVVALLSLGGCGEKPHLKIESQPQEPTTPLLRDVTAESNIVHTYRNGEEADEFTILESLGGGAAIIDFDGDGLYDVFVTGGGYFEGKENKLIKAHPCKFFKNLG